MIVGSAWCLYRSKLHSIAMSNKHRKKLALITGITGQDGVLLAELLLGCARSLMGMSASAGKTTWFLIRVLCAPPKPGQPSPMRPRPNWSWGA